MPYSRLLAAPLVLTAAFSVPAPAQTAAAPEPFGIADLQHPHLAQADLDHFASATEALSQQMSDDPALRQAIRSLGVSFYPQDVAAALRQNSSAGATLGQFGLSARSYLHLYHLVSAALRESQSAVAGSLVPGPTSFFSTASAQLVMNNRLRLRSALDGLRRAASAP